MVDHRRQVQRVDCFNITHLEHTFEQQDRMREPGFAQARRFVQIEQGETVGGTHRAGGAQQAMSVGIGLDHSPHSRIRRSLAHHCEVMRKCA